MKIFIKFNNKNKPIYIDNKFFGIIPKQSINEVCVDKANSETANLIIKNDDVELLIKPVVIGEKVFNN